jgi:hypothetical protein
MGDSRTPLGACGKYKLKDIYKKLSVKITVDNNVL